MKQITFYIMSLILLGCNKDDEINLYSLIPGEYNGEIFTATTIDSLGNRVIDKSTAFMTSAVVTEHKDGYLVVFKENGTIEIPTFYIEMWWNDEFIKYDYFDVLEPPGYEKGPFSYFSTEDFESIEMRFIVNGFNFRGIKN